MNSYNCLPVQELKLNNYSIVPIRYIDIQEIRRWRNEQIDVLRQKTVLSGFSWAIRFTRLISVPTAQELPEGALAIVLEINSVEPFKSADCTTSIKHSGCTITLTAGSCFLAISIWATENLVWTEQWPCQRIILDLISSSFVSPPRGLNGFQTTISSKKLHSNLRTQHEP